VILTRPLGHLLPFGGLPVRLRFLVVPDPSLAYSSLLGPDPGQGLATQRGPNPVLAVATPLSLDPGRGLAMRLGPGLTSTVVRKGPDPDRSVRLET
jgi:hypothetical protein